MSTGESWGSKQAHRAIHQPVSVVSQCGAGAWLNGLASGVQRRLMGSGSTLEACSRRCAIQIHRYLRYGPYLYFTTTATATATATTTTTTTTTAAAATTTTTTTTQTFASY